MRLIKLTLTTVVVACCFVHAFSASIQNGKMEMSKILNTRKATRTFNELESFSLFIIDEAKKQAIKSYGSLTGDIKSISIVLDDEGKKIFSYLLANKATRGIDIPPTYVRKSSHFKRESVAGPSILSSSFKKFLTGFLKLGGLSQYGVDLKKPNSLPNSWDTLLFAPLTDARLFVKFENTGTSNTHDFFLHMIDYMRKQKMLNSGTGDNADMYREIVPRDIRTKFSDLLLVIIPDKKERKTMLEEGLHYGAHRMKDIVLETHSDCETATSFLALLDERCPYLSDNLPQRGREIYLKPSALL